MANYRLVLAIFCSFLTIFGQTVFGHQGRGSVADTQKLGKAVGIVRMENGKAVCVKAAEGYSFISNEVPTCSDEQSEIALNLAQSGVPARTAWITHAGFAVAGCLIGAASAMGGMSLESGLSDDGRSSQTGAIVGPVAVGGFGSLVMAASGEPTGHILAGVGGLIVCGGIINYLVYSERNR